MKLINYIRHLKEIAEIARHENMFPLTIEAGLHIREVYINKLKRFDL